MDPTMYLAASNLDTQPDRDAAIEEFYVTHGKLPVWVRLSAALNAAARRLRELRPAAEPGPGFAAPRAAR